MMGMEGMMTTMITIRWGNWAGDWERCTHVGEGSLRETGLRASHEYRRAEHTQDIKSLTLHRVLDSRKVIYGNPLPSLTALATSLVPGRFSAYLSYESRYNPSSLVVALTLSSPSIASTHLSHRLPGSGSGHARYGLSTFRSLTTHGAICTSTNDMSTPRKKGPSGCAASTSVAMCFASSFAFEAWSSADCACR